MNPYKVLGIKKDATHTEIKTAYRKLSKVHHPDVGGNENKFQSINLAYRVLSDSKKRKLYDDTGIVDDESPNHIENLIKARMVEISEKWIDNMLKGQKIPLQKFVINGFDDARNQILVANQDLKKTIVDIKQVYKKLTCSEDDSIVHGVIDHRIKQYQQGIKQNETEIKVMDKLREIITTYEYEEEVEQIITNTTIMGSFTTSGNGRGIYW